MPDERKSTPAEIKVAEAKAGLYSRIFFGVFCILAGAGVFIWGIRLDLQGANGNAEVFWTTNHALMVGGAILAVFGGMMLPSVFDSAKPVITFFLPNGIPVIGGRRSTDPQPEQKDGSTGQP